VVVVSMIRCDSGEMDKVIYLKLSGRDWSEENTSQITGLD